MCPRSARHPCNHPGCPQLLERGKPYCEAHQPKRVRGPDNRLSAAQRGYDSRWQEARQDFLAANPSCVECLRRNRQRLQRMWTILCHTKATKSCSGIGITGGLCAHIITMRKQPLATVGLVTRGGSADGPVNVSEPGWGVKTLAR